MAIDNTTLDQMQGDVDQTQGEVDQAAADTQAASASGGPLSAVSEQLKLRNLQSQLDKERKAQLTAAWYPAPADPLAEAPVKQPGIMERALGALSLPIRGAVGAAEWASGKSDVGLADTINKNVQDPSGDMWGDYLRKIGVQNKWVSTLGGFALDVATDPINWYSAGWRGLIPDTFQGLVKGGPEGAALAGKAWGAKVASKIASPVLSFKDDASAALSLESNLFKADRDVWKAWKSGKIGASEAIDQAWEKLPKFFQARIKYPGFSEASAKLNENLDSLLGFHPLDAASEGVFQKLDFKKGADALLEKMPNGQAVRDWAMMDNGASLLRNRALANAETSAPQLREMVTGLPDEDFQNILEKLRTSELGQYDSALVEAADKSKTQDEFFRNYLANETTMNRVLSAHEQMVQAGFSSEALSAFRPDMTPEEFMGAIANSGADASSLVKDRLSILANLLRDGVRTDARSKGFAPYVGVKVYDDTIDAIRDRWKVQLGGKEKKIGEGLLGVLDTLRKTFVSMRLSKWMNPATYLNEVASVPALLHMQGLDAFDPSAISTWREAMDFAYGRESAPAAKLAISLFGDPSNAAHFEKYQDEIRMIFGMSPQQLSGKVKDFLNSNGTNYALWSKTEGRGFQKYGDLKEFFAKFSKVEGENPESLGKALDAALKRKNGEEAATIYLPALQKKKRPEGVKPSFLADDQLTFGFQDLEAKLKGLAERGGAGSAFAKAFNFVINDARTFDRPDQTGRLFTFTRLTRDGIKPSELIKVQRTVGGISKSDIVGKIVKNGEYRFLLSPAKASEVTLKLSASYADVPKLVTALRNIPVVGSPFASFPYIMAVKTMTALKNNPAAINDVQKFLHELSNPKDPLEAAALQSKYNSWLNGPGKVRLGTFGGNLGNPIYASLTAALPWYSLSIFDTSEKSYPSTLFGDVSEAIDRLPLMKTAAGQMMWNHYIAPAIVGSELAQNQFGTRLYPEGATGEEQALYALRSLVEGYMPSSAAIPFAIPGISSAISEAVTEAIPINKVRTMIRATKGETPLGITSQEPAASRTNRALLSTFGVPTYVVDETNASQNLDNTQ